VRGHKKKGVREGDAHTIFLDLNIRQIVWSRPDQRPYPRTSENMPESTPECSVGPSKAPNDATVIFVDWDDTLLCSSHLSAQGLRLDSEVEMSKETQRELKELEGSVLSLLRLAKLHGEVYVVTNAETGWVQLSAKKFIPGVLSALDDVKVLSARSTYQTMFPDAPIKWKFCAFQERLGRVSVSETRRNIISFGDSHVEREAVRAVTRGLPNTLTKSVKFAERPSMEQLRRQLELVVSCFQYLVTHDGDLDLQLTVTVTASAAAAGVPSLARPQAQTVR